MSAFDRTMDDIEAVLSQEQQEAVEKDRHRGYWGLTGQLQIAALHMLRKVVALHADEASQLFDYQQAIRDLVIAKHRFAEEYPDEDGFGSATFDALIRPLVSMAQSRGGLPLATCDTLVRAPAADEQFSLRAYYLTLNPLLDEPLSLFAAGKYRDCCFDIEKHKLNIASEASFGTLVRLLLVSGMRARLADESRVTNILAAVEDPWERLLTTLASGRAQFADVEREATGPLRKCAAHYWHSAALMTRGLEEEARQESATCRRMALPCPEWVLATLESGDLPQA
jgi:hypothetical protein